MPTLRTIHHRDGTITRHVVHHHRHHYTIDGVTRKHRATTGRKTVTVHRSDGTTFKRRKPIHHRM